MKKQKSLRMLVLGLVIGILVAATTTLAATSAITSASFNETSIIFDGQVLDLPMPLISVVTTENPDAVSNFMPVRAVLEAMGYEIGWDGENNAVLVFTPDGANLDEEAGQQRPTYQATPTTTVWLAGTGGTVYHSVNNCGNMNPNNAIAITRQEAHDRDIRACLRCW